MVQLLQIVRQVRKETSGLIASMELLLVATVILLGMLTGMAAVRDSVVSEISDVGGSLQDLNQSYRIWGLVGHSGHSVGMGYQDGLDFCDSSGDPNRAADNCIEFNVPPTNEEMDPPRTGLVTEFSFDGIIDDTSPEGTENTGVLQGDAHLENGKLVLDGDGDFLAIGNSDDINLVTQDERTITLDFYTDDVDTRQVLYEEGASVRGLVIYIDDGNLYIGGWNIPDNESGWDPTFISTPISAGTTNSVALVLDGTPTEQPGALTGYLNGTSFGSAAGSQLWPHGGAIGLGAINGDTIFHDGTQSSGAYFNGCIDNFSIFNNALSGAEVESLVP